MANFKGVLTQLQKERRDLVSQLQRINDAIAALGGVGGGRKGGKERRRKLSPTAIARIRSAQKLRWAKWRKAHKD
jgi:hypothetical protein